MVCVFPHEVLDVFPTIFVWETLQNHHDVFWHDWLATSSQRKFPVMDDMHILTKVNWVSGTSVHQLRLGKCHTDIYVLASVPPAIAFCSEMPALGEIR